MNRNRKKAVAASVAVGMTMVMGFSPVLAANTDISKEETVYVNAASDGTPQEITVSDWLKNSASAGDLSDVSDLKDIKNVKGDETFSQNGDKLTWDTDDKDIYYQGTTEKELPVSVKLTYYLDGKKISGSAQCIHKNRVMYHCTLLFSANLDVLHTVLKGKSDELESIPGLKNIRAVPSVPSEVANLNCFLDVSVLSLIHI